VWAALRSTLRNPTAHEQGHGCAPCSSEPSRGIATTTHWPRLRPAAATPLVADCGALVGSQRVRSSFCSPITFRFLRFPAQLHLSSVTGSARNPFGSGKPFAARQTTAAVATRALPTTLRTKSRFTVSPTSGSAVHFASKSSKHPPVSTTKSTSRVRSRQNMTLPVHPARGPVVCNL
jgi:hypothetical protein